MSPYRSVILLNHFYWFVSHGGTGSLLTVDVVAGCRCGQGLVTETRTPLMKWNVSSDFYVFQLHGKKAQSCFSSFCFFSFALKYRLQCWTSRGVFFIVNQYWSIGSLGVEYGSISHQAVEEIWFQLAREARSRFPSSGNSRHGNISQMDWYRLARTFLATEPAQGNFCHISLMQLGQAVKKRGCRVPQWPSMKSTGQTLNKCSIISMNCVFS